VYSVNVEVYLSLTGKDIKKSIFLMDINYQWKYKNIFL